MIILPESKEEKELTPEAVRRAMRRGGLRALLSKGDVVNIRNGKTPASASAPGRKGDVSWDSTYIYVHIGSAWRRVAHSAF